MVKSFFLLIESFFCVLESNDLEIVKRFSENANWLIYQYDYF